MEEQLYTLLRQCTMRIDLPKGHGTGFFVAPGLILTCAHVVKSGLPGGSFAIFWRGAAYAAQLQKSVPGPDLALLSLDLVEHPCVWLHAGATPFDRLYSYGYSDEHPEGIPTIFTLEGQAGDQDEELKFQSGQVRPGMSGGPLLNTQTGGVCGIVRLTRDRGSDLGGWAIPTALLLQTFPELVALQEQFHRRDQRWLSYLDSQSDKKARLMRSRMIDQSDYIHDRLERFVGRRAELAELQRRIAEKREMGGYVLLVGKAGQGKSSLVARMVQDQGEDNCVYHFVQEGSGANFPITVVRNLIARLILKYDLPEYYLSGESYEILCGNFLGVLRALGESHAQETIYIDGLDQLKTNSAALPDLNFLPSQLPTGIVIVLGTRPNETLEPIRRITHVGERESYPLPGLSREDFGLLLAKHDVPGRAALSDSLYQRLTDNPLYLDLVAQELRASEGLGAEELVSRVASNPNDIFTITFSRMRELAEWDAIIRPMLGTLFVAQEPLTVGQIAHIIKQQNVHVRAARTRLGGLLTQAGPQHYVLFHPKLKEYLTQNKDDPDNEIPFEVEEGEQLHGLFVDWCQQGPLEQLWVVVSDPTPQDDYQEYAQKHYLFHLHASRRYKQIFAVLDDGIYERGKLDADPSTHSTAQDLLLGCRAAARGAMGLDEGKHLLTHLWSYTLLRASLTTQADAYPITAFQALLALNRVREALDLAELLTRPDKKLAVLNLIAAFLLKQSAHVVDGEQLVNRIYDSAISIPDDETRTETLRELAATLIQMGRLAQAEEVARFIVNNREQIDVLSEISAAYGKRDDWQQARTVAMALSSEEGRAQALSHLAGLRRLAGETEEAETLWQEAGIIATAITDDLQRSQALFSLSVSFVYGQEWQRALDVAQSIPLLLEKIRALSQVASALTRAGETSSHAWEEARNAIAALDEREQKEAEYIYAMAQLHAGLFDEAEDSASRYLNDHPTERSLVFGSLASALIRDRLWEQSKHVIGFIMREYDLSDVASSVLDNILVRLSIDLAERDQWEWAAETAQAIPDQEARCRALMGIVSEQARAGEVQMARENWVEASALCRAQADTVQPGVAATLVAALAEVGEIEQARRIISSLPDKYMQEESMTVLALTFACAGQIAQAEEIENNIASSIRKADIKRGIARAQMDAGHFEQAVATAQAVTGAGRRSQALVDLVEICCRAGQWDHAWDIANQVPSEPLRARALDMLIVGLACAGQVKRAEKIANDIKHGYFKANSICRLATTLAQMGNVKEARRLANSIRKNPRIQRKAYCNISLSAGMFRATVAEADARLIEASSERDEALCSVAVAYAQEGSWAEAENIVSEINGEKEREEAWKAIAIERANAEQWDEALASLDKIQKDTSHLKDTPRLTVLRAWGTLLTQPAKRVIRERIEQHLDDSQERAELFISIAAELAKARNDLEQIRLTQHAWLEVRTKDDCRALFAMIQYLLPHISETCMEFYASFAWADVFLAEA